MLPQLGRLFIILGAVLLAVGLWLTFAPHVSFGRLGRLPGDIHIKRDNFTFYFPLTTCILISVLLTLLFSILSRK
jgi:formate hydrogenlyase subunit 3/multisubunit Na+/H+ antiporter MnhD subunit